VELGTRAEGSPDVAFEQGRWNRMAALLEVPQEGVEHGRRGEASFHAIALGWRRVLEGRAERIQRALAPAEEFDLAKLSGLHPTRRFEQAAEGAEADWTHRLEDVDLAHQRLQDGADPAQPLEALSVIGRNQMSVQQIELVQQLPKPELVDLVDRDEEGLVVFDGGGAGALELQQRFELKVGCVRQPSDLLCLRTLPRS